MSCQAINTAWWSVAASSPGSQDPAAEVGFSDSWRGAVARSRLARTVGSVWAGLGCCLMYHRVSADEPAQTTSEARFDPNRELRVGVDTFDAQMRFLSRNYHCLALPEAIELLRAGRLPHKSVVVTFDDGYLDNLTLALPILRAHKVPATVYVATGMIENTASLWWQELEHIIATNKELRVRQGDRVRHFRLDSAGARQRAYSELNHSLKSMNSTQQDEFMDVLRQQSDSGDFSYADQVLDRQQLLELA
ncbi:MAG: polysaccharide deacetylase family protein, partial [Wenzhouxiangella sp.]